MFAVGVGRWMEGDGVVDEKRGELFTIYLLYIFYIYNKYIVTYFSLSARRQ